MGSGIPHLHRDVMWQWQKANARRSAPVPPRSTTEWVGEENHIPGLAVVRTMCDIVAGRPHIESRNWSVSSLGIITLHSYCLSLSLTTAAVFAIVAADIADARVGGGGSGGSRGTRTYSAPPSTTTAPKAAPIEKSMTQKGTPTAQNAQPGA